MDTLRKQTYVKVDDDALAVTPAGETAAPTTPAP